MVKRKRFWLLAILFGSGLLATAPSGLAGPKEDRIREGERQLESVNRRQEQVRNGIPKLQEQIKAAVADQQKMESVLPGMKAEAEAARKAMDEADERIRAAKKSGVEIRAQVEESQGPDSELTRAKNAYEKARQEYQEEVDFIVDQLKDKDSYRRALESDDHKSAARMRKDALDHDSEAAAAKETLTKARSAYDAAREAMVASNPEFAAAKSEYEAAMAEGKEIDQRAKPVMSRFRLAQKQYKRHLKDIAKARSTVARGEAEVRNLENLKQRISRQLEEVRRHP